MCSMAQWLHVILRRSKRMLMHSECSNSYSSAFFVVITVVISFLLSANARLHSFRTDVDVYRRRQSRFVALLSITFMEYIAFMAIAPQWYSLCANMSSILNWMKIWFEIDQFSSLLDKTSTNRSDWQKKKGKPPPFRFLWTSRIESIERRKNKFFQWHQNHDLYMLTNKHCCQLRVEFERERKSGSSSNIVCHTKVKWSGFIDHHFHYMYWCDWFENWNTLDL